MSFSEGIVACIILACLKPLPALSCAQTLPFRSAGSGDAIHPELRKGGSGHKTTTSHGWGRTANEIHLAGQLI